MNYYNEFDHNAAEWLRQLIEDKLIPKGDVDERSIADVRATDLVGYTQCHFFAGIGGWPLALQLAGWPESRPVWTGSCPCQAFSTAGKQLGFADERDLWPVFRNLIAECKPDVVFGEQVENAIKHGWLDRVYTELERENYACGSVVLGAHSVGAPHRRYRLYWGGCLLANTEVIRPKSANSFPEQTGWRSVESTGRRGVCGVADNDGQRLEREPVPALSGGYDCAEVAGRGSDCGVDDAGLLGQEKCEEQTTRNEQYCAAGGVANGNGERQQEQRDTITVAAEVVDELRGIQGLPPWQRSAFIFCRDNKIRRVPAESLLFGVADGVSGELDGIRVEGISETGGFPLTTQKEGRAMLLRGYGNAIVPQVAAEFVKAFMAEME